ELRGTPGQRRLTRDSRGRVMDVVDDPEHLAHPGRDVVLTLDAVIQLFTERALDELVAEARPEACCAIVLDPNSGDVLGMASRPSFDPNHADNVPDAAWKNRAIADIYEPGSTFKPMIVAYGLDRRMLAVSDQYDCEWGRYRMGRRLLHDHHPYGTLSLTDVLVKSSNIGMAKVGEQMTNAGLHSAAAVFGFGRRTGIELPGELPGILRPLDEWTSYSTGSIPMGHEIAATPLQLITAHAALANGGTLVRPRILKSRPADGPDDLRNLVQTTVSADVARWVVQEPMQQVVTRGTGKRAKIEGYDVFGKTGTAQCLSPNGGYVHGKYISSFVCGAPVQNPRLLVLVVVNQATGSGGEVFGGRIAAPVAAKILRESLLHLRISPVGTDDSWASGIQSTRR
ncbi:MAG: penicillin-binding protein 2, partial [Planctomycetaceae bacterium]|nr:penicillin-binding protein 2 [Planctomycetaceae bacterium]